MHAKRPFFPVRPIRDVKAVYARQSSCFGDCGVVTVDFEPGAEGVVFEVAVPLDIHGFTDIDQAELYSFQAALEEGIREELAELDAVTTAAVTVVLRSMEVHAQDSRPRSFRAAGRIAVHAAFALTES
ncbi:hypothetical protein [Streptomyces sp. NPDC059788]|uniref:hypothetical protein n=1 Tax=Streptomyces sp. NPDC059788 TaxID=3346948 RepID=UPI0036610682